MRDQPSGAGSQDRLESMQTRQMNVIERKKFHDLFSRASQVELSFDARVPYTVPIQYDLGWSRPAGASCEMDLTFDMKTKV